MNSNRIIRWVLGVVLSWMVASTVAAGELRETIKIPVIHTSTNSYTNVSVLSRSGTDIHIRHDGGVGNVRLEELDARTRRALGLEGDQEAESEGEVLQEGGLDSGARPAIDLSALLGGAGFTAGFLAIFGGVLLAIYLVGCYLWKRICLNAGHDPGFLIWIPILQMIPLFRAAGMSPLWILGMLLPLVNLVVGIIWCFKIVAACGKSFIWAIFMFLPLLNLVAILYLAFSGPGSSDEFPASRPPPLAM